IGYIFPGKYHNRQLPAIKQLFKDTKAIIVDMRCYPSEFMPFTFGSYLKPAPGAFVKFGLASLDAPGMITIGTPVVNGGDSTDYYKGKIIVIVDASTQSQAEYTTMSFQSGPNTTVIGSTTAGADGNVSSIYLPGNIFTYMSGLGVLYPDGRESQRVGVRIDIPIRPTIRGIKEGRDEMLEKAIELAEKKQPLKGF
ncbi:MAG TPA: S41 family peptidase, partial [Chitinophagaceae bacterium]|nr:S41 family peptidase [Chitinophagaceae bacterium]